MKKSALLSLGISGAMGLVAAILMNHLLNEQRARMAATEPVKVEIPSSTIVVAAKPMRFGGRINPGDLRLMKWMSEEVPKGAFRAIKDVLPRGDDKRYALAAIEPGEPLLTTRISAIGDRATLSTALQKGMRAVSIRVNDVLGVAGFVRPADHVDILLTRVVEMRNEPTQTYVDVILQGVKVLAVDQTADERDDKPSVVKTVTLEVSTEEAQAITLASEVGTLSLALRNVASADVASTRPITLADLGGGPVSKTLSREVERRRTKEGPSEELTVSAPVDRGFGTVGVWNAITREVHHVRMTLN